MSVFISYSSEDLDFAKRLKADLEKRNVEAWSADSSINLGESIIKTIKSAIEEAEIIIVILSRKSSKSPWVSSEIAIAVSHLKQGVSKKIIPVIIEKNVEIPFFLKDIHCLDMSDEKEYERNINVLANAIMSPRDSEQDINEINKAKLEYLKSAQDSLNFEIRRDRLERSESFYWFLTNFVPLVLTITVITIGILTFGGIIYVKVNWANLWNYSKYFLFFSLGIITTIVANFIYLKIRKRLVLKRNRMEGVK